MERIMQTIDPGNRWLAISKKVWIAGALTTTLLLFVIWRNIAPERSTYETGPRAILDLCFAIIFTLTLTIICTGIGHGILLLLKTEGWSLGENIVFSFAVGAGIVGMTIFLVGASIGLQPGILLFTLIACGIFAAPGLLSLSLEMFNGKAFLQQTWRSLDGKKRTLVFLTGIILITCFIRAAAPPWDPDGLIYHLQAPRLFLQYGRIIPLPEDAPGNYPLTVEMLFMAGMAFGCDTAARLIHVVFLIVFLGAACLFARRFFSIKTAWITLVILLSIPILPYWGTLAYADLGWAVFEFLSLYALFLWQKELNWRLLILGAVFTGFAMGSKYLAAGNTAILAFFILWVAGKAGGRKAICCLFLFGSISILIAIPWLIKNIIGFQNPIYPLAFGLFPSSKAQQLWTEYMQYGFGAGRSFLNYLLLPWNLYFRHDQFSTVGGTIELPSLFFPFAIFALWKRGNQLLLPLGLILFARFGFWAIGAQQIRLLLPLFPGLAVLAAIGLEVLEGAWNNAVVRRIVATGLFGGMVAVSLFYQLVDTLSTKPWLSVLGLETKETFLTRMVSDFGADRYIENNLPPDSKVLLLWDGRGYYCGIKCVSDTFHAKWTSLVIDEPPPEEVARVLEHQGITHILISHTDINFILQHDPSGLQRDAWEYLQNSFITQCAKEVYNDPWTQLMEINCQGRIGSTFYSRIKPVPIEVIQRSP
jgi:4-amino-4-deoxy-L-arabinose transferase-like glycosyltransferase